MKSKFTSLNLGNDLNAQNSKKMYEKRVRDKSNENDKRNERGQGTFNFDINLGLRVSLNSPE